MLREEVAVATSRTDRAAAVIVAAFATLFALAAGAAPAVFALHVVQGLGSIVGVPIP